jgi:hypothetical protein
MESVRAHVDAVPPDRGDTLLRHLLLFCAATFPTFAVAQITHQNVMVSPEGEKRVVRHVILKDEHGIDTFVEQHLIELENGDYLYLHGSQPRATRELDERICAIFGATVSKGSVVRLSTETLGGGSCRTEVPLEPSASARKDLSWVF